MALNLVILNGRIANDLELKKTSSGKSVIQFSVATPNTPNSTDFHRCDAWDKTAEFISKYFKKGDGILIRGEIHYNIVDSGKVKTTYTNILVREVMFADSNKLTSKDEVVKQSVPVVDTYTKDMKKAEEVDELPF